MSILKRNKSTLILFSLALVFFMVNYICLFKLENKIIFNEYNEFNKEQISNADKLDDEEIKSLSYDDKKQLAYKYSARGNYDKSKEMCLLILDQYPTDRDVIYLYSYILEHELNFEESKKYLKNLLSVSTGRELFNVYNLLASVSITDNIDEAIMYFNHAVKLKDFLDAGFSKNEIDFIANKFKVLERLKELHDAEELNPIEYYKEIIKDNSNAVNYNVKRYMYLEYKNQYSHLYPESFHELTLIFNSLEAY